MIGYKRLSWDAKNRHVPSTVNTYQYFRERVYDLDKEAGYDRTDRGRAWKKSWEWGEKIPIGIFYQIERPTLADQHAEILKVPLVSRQQESGFVENLLAEFKV